MNNKINKLIMAAGLVAMMGSCVPTLVQKNENKAVPQGYSSATDTNNTAKVQYKNFFKDTYLIGLIDTALQNNQELNIILQEIQIAQNEVRARKGQYLPFVNAGLGTGIDKAAKYTRNGAVDENVIIEPGVKIPKPLPDFALGVYASWELDIWKKLRNGKKSATYKYLASVEGKNFMTSHLIREIASSYYELMALDNEMDILKKNIEIQQNALETVRQEKNAARVTELAVRRFEAEIAKNQSELYYIMQEIVETENKINFLVGRFPKPIARNSQAFIEIPIDSLQAGIPTQLLSNRPDVRQAEMELYASKLNVKIAKANFLPAANIRAGLGYQAFNLKHFINTPESILFNAAGDLVAPLINRNAIKAEYLSANARQIQAVFNYERSILNAYTEVSNQISSIKNLSKSYEWKATQVDALSRSVSTSINLFKNARADYVEILLTQRDALESKIQLVQIKKHQLNANVKMYQVLGGGWR